jgi:protein ImuB
MPLTHARALVPNLDIRPADPDGVAADLHRLATHAARHWTPLVTIVPEEGLWLDIGASAHLFGGEKGFARRLLALCRRLGLAARVAIADTAAAAHALAKSAIDPITLCPPGREAEALAPLPLSALPLDPDAAETARRLGIDTVGALAALPRAPLVRRFGQALVDRLDEALGRRAQPIELLVPAETPSAQRRFAEPLLTAEPIAAATSELVHDLCARLAAAHRGARLLGLTLTRLDAYDQRIEIGLARPSRDPDHIARLFGTRLDQVEPGFGIERMVLVAERWDPLAPEAVPSALAGAERAAEEAVLVDRLATRLGQRRLYRLGAVESDVPERCVRRLGPIETDCPDWEPWPRPVRLLDPPEQVEGVMALLPDGVPKRFTWRGKAYNVVRGDGPERIHGEWWRRAAERDSIRDYFQVEDQAGARFWLYRRGDALDERTGDLSWHLTACSRDRLSAARRSPECGRLFRNQASSRPTSGSEPQVRGPLL